MAENQDPGKQKDLNAEEQQRRQGKADSGDASNKGRERREDDASPRHRNAGDFGTHGGPNKRNA